MHGKKPTCLSIPDQRIRYSASWQCIRRHNSSTHCVSNPGVVTPRQRSLGAGADQTNKTTTFPNFPITTSTLTTRFPNFSHQTLITNSTNSAYPTSLRPQDIQLPQQARPAVLQLQPCRPPPTRKRTSPRSTSSRSRAAPSSSPNSYAETAPLVAELCPAHGYIDPRPNHPNRQIKQFHYSIHTILFQRGVYPAEDFTAYVPPITILPTPPSTLPFWSTYR